MVSLSLALHSTIFPPPLLFPSLSHGLSCCSLPPTSISSPQPARFRSVCGYGNECSNNTQSWKVSPVRGCWCISSCLLFSVCEVESWCRTLLLFQRMNACSLSPSFFISLVSTPSFPPFRYVFLQFVFLWGGPRGRIFFQLGTGWG